MHTAKSVLVVAAHPDDEILGAGATMAKHVAAGDEVTVLILGEGVVSRKEVVDGQSMLEALRADAERAAKIIGVKKLLFKNLPDNKLDSLPLLEIIQIIEEVVATVKPHIVYTHHHGDVNIDHHLIAKAMQAVCRPMKGNSVERVCAFEVPSATDWNFRASEKFNPTVFFNVEKYIATKIAAMECYQSEIRDFPHPRSSRYLRALAEVRGGQAGFESAEAFELVYEKQV